MVFVPCHALFQGKWFYWHWTGTIACFEKGLGTGSEVVIPYTKFHPVSSLHKRNKTWVRNTCFVLHYFGFVLLGFLFGVFNRRNISHDLKKKKNLTLVSVSLKWRCVRKQRMRCHIELLYQMQGFACQELCVRRYWNFPQCWKSLSCLQPMALPRQRPPARSLRNLHACWSGTFLSCKPHRV